MTLRVGVARADITPPLGSRWMGYPDSHGQRTASGVREPLHATALGAYLLAEEIYDVPVEQNLKLLRRPANCDQ